VIGCAPHIAGQLWPLIALVAVTVLVVAVLAVQVGRLIERRKADGHPCRDGYQPSHVKVRRPAGFYDAERWLRLDDTGHDPAAVGPC
jgi:hypothetical protein